MLTSRQKNLRRSLVSIIEEVKARLYGKDGYAIEKPISQGIEGKIPEDQGEEREDPNSG